MQLEREPWAGEEVTNRKRMEWKGNLSAGVSFSPHSRTGVGLLPTGEALAFLLLLCSGIQDIKPEQVDKET